MTVLLGSRGDSFLVPDDLDQVPWGSNRYAIGKTPSIPRLRPGESTAVLAIFSQSNGCDTIDAAYTPVHGNKIDNFNFCDGGTYAAVDPLLGCTIKDSAHIGNLFLLVADKLISAGWRQRIILAPCGYSGTPIGRWAPGGVINRRLLVAPQRLAMAGLPVTANIWMQGESDNIPFATSEAAYAAWLAGVIGTPRAMGFNAPWLIGICSYINDTVSSAVQAAQTGAINPAANIFAGANSDLYTGLANRQPDLTHIKAAGVGFGRDAIAEAWKTAIMNALD